MKTTTPCIAVFDLSVTRNSPAGSCVLAEVMGLADQFDITVFSDRFDNERPDRVRWVRVPLPQKPVFLRYMVFHLLAPIALRRHIREKGAAPALIQATQAQFIGADICYAHFCHRAYLRHQWKLQNAKGLRRLARWVVHTYNAAAERRAFLRAKQVVVVSLGLQRELLATYPFLEGRVSNIPNPVDVAGYVPLADFDKAAVRGSLGLTAEQRVLCFAALGDFERKGLGIVLSAMADIQDTSIRLVVLGGNKGEIAQFKARGSCLGITDRVVFAGFQKDIKPYFWALDLFVFPSLYENFPLVVIQAMAAGLPVVVTRLHGVEEYAEHGSNAWVVERDPESVRQAILDALQDRDRLRAVGENARRTATRYDRKAFVDAWTQRIELTLGHGESFVGGLGHAVSRIAE